jgi:hypothetical protein
MTIVLNLTFSFYPAEQIHMYLVALKRAERLKQNEDDFKNFCVCIKHQFVQFQGENRGLDPAGFDKELMSKLNSNYLEGEKAITAVSSRNSLSMLAIEHLFAETNI